MSKVTVTPVGNSPQLNRLNLFHNFFSLPYYKIMKNESTYYFLYF